MNFVSHSQNFEDLMLWRALGGVQKGLYIDVGAQDPQLDSVSLAFYQRGWRGIHVEPTVQYSEKLRSARPDELVLQVALGRDEGILTFFEIADTGLSTTSTEIAEQHRTQGFDVKQTSVPVMTLDAVLTSLGEREVHWLKIDVEGAEQDVLAGWQSSPVRPWIVVIESTLPLSKATTHHKWEDLILQKGYSFAYFDGLNRFYVCNAHAELRDKFSAPPNVFDQFVLTASHHLCAEAHIETREARAETMRGAAIIRQYADTTRQLEAQAAKKDELEETCARLHGELHAAQSMNQGLAQALTDMRASTSWRATAPLRWTAIQIRLLIAQGPRARWSALVRRAAGSTGSQYAALANAQAPEMPRDQRAISLFSEREQAVNEVLTAAIGTATKKH